MSIPRPESVLARTENSTPSARQHWPALDALRGLAMLLGVVLHASVSYMPHAMTDLVWAIRDDSVSPLFDWLFWSIHSFRLPLFFAMAGFFTIQLQESRGTRGYVLHRSRRLLVPLLGASLILLPLTFGVWAFGWLVSGQCSLHDIQRMTFSRPIQTNLYGPAHLWFIEYLYLMCLLFGGFCWLRARWPARRTPTAWLELWLASWWFPLVPAVPTAGLVWLSPTVISGFHNSFIPDVPRFAYYGVFFVTGIVLASARPRLESCFGPTKGWLLVPCLPLLLSGGFLLQQHLEHGLTVPGRLALGASFGLLASLALFGFLSLALCWCPRERPLLRYLADASYWIYLVHFPLIGLAQVLLAPLPWPAVAKFGLVLVLTLTVGFATYRRYVRYTFLGHFLNGTRQKPATLSLPSRSAAA
jgi:glucan biosynthesis protein C